LRSGMNARRKVLIVDGNNVIHALPDLLKLLKAPGGRRSGLAHRELERRLTNYQDETGERVVLVFDGRGEKVEKSDPRDGGVQVLRSGSGSSADAIIERLVVRYAGDYDLQVASDDRAVQNAVAAVEATGISVAGLAALLDRADRDLGRLLESKR
jgi:predicted RNA-binding protein with PIN domain